MIDQKKQQENMEYLRFEATLGCESAKRYLNWLDLSRALHQHFNEEKYFEENYAKPIFATVEKKGNQAKEGQSDHMNIYKGMLTDERNAYCNWQPDQDFEKILLNGISTWKVWGEATKEYFKPMVYNPMNFSENDWLVPVSVFYATDKVCRLPQRYEFTDGIHDKPKPYEYLEWEHECRTYRARKRKWTNTAELMLQKPVADFTTYLGVFKEQGFLIQEMYLCFVRKGRLERFARMYSKDANYIDALK